MIFLPFPEHRSTRHIGQKPAGRGGFTLIEMLVVVFIIGLLAAILIPVSMDMFGESKRHGTRALMQKLDTGLEAFESTFQELPKSTTSFTVKQRNRWQDVSFRNTMVGRSAQLHTMLGAKLQHVTSYDDATGNQTYGEAGPFIDFQPREIRDGKVDDYSQPIIDAWDRVVRVRFEGRDHTEREGCGTRNNKNWIDIWSEGTKVEDRNRKGPQSYDGCDEDDINNFGSVER